MSFLHCSCSLTWTPLCICTVCNACACVWNRITSNETTGPFSPSSNATVHKAHNSTINHKEAHLPRSLITCSRLPPIWVIMSFKKKYSHSPPNLLNPFSHYWDVQHYSGYTSSMVAKNMLERTKWQENIWASTVCQHNSVKRYKLLNLNPIPS